MNVFQTTDVQTLAYFPKRQDQLAIVARKRLDGADVFFEKLMQIPLRLIGKVSKRSSLKDIENILEEDISDALQADNFYKVWIADMAKVCEIFCNTLGSDAVSFCLGTQRGCRRYHIDNVPMRLLVTYAGCGTEWIPDEAVDRTALKRGAPNEQIIKNPSAAQFMEPWDIAIFRGGPKGLLHRTPEVALNGQSILMRLDHENFWDNKYLQQAS